MWILPSQSCLIIQREEEKVISQRIAEEKQSSRQRTQTFFIMVLARTEGKLLGSQCAIFLTVFENAVSLKAF